MSRGIDGQRPNIRRFKLICSLALWTSVGCGYWIGEKQDGLSAVSIPPAEAQADDSSKIFIPVKNSQRRTITIQKVTSSCPCIECRSQLPFDVPAKGDARLEFDVVHPPDGKVQVSVSVFTDSTTVAAVTIPVTVGSSAGYPVFSQFPREVIWRAVSATDLEPLRFYITTLEVPNTPPWLTGFETSPGSVAATIVGLPEEGDGANNVVPRTYTIEVTELSEARPELAQIRGAIVTAVTTPPSAKPLQIWVRVVHEPLITASPEVFIIRRNEVGKELRAVLRGPNSDWSAHPPLHLPIGIASVAVTSLDDDPECRLVQIGLADNIVDAAHEIPITVATDVPQCPEATILIRAK